MSQFIDSRPIGSQVEFKGPRGNFIYKPNMCRAIGMLAGGSGLTPMLQIIRSVVRNPNDSTLLSLIFANVNGSDILMKKELDEIANAHKNFKVFYVLNNVRITVVGIYHLY